jgi:hypothetical protein
VAAPFVSDNACSVRRVEVDFIGREAFIRNKRVTGRLKDLADVEGRE